MSRVWPRECTDGYELVANTSSSMKPHFAGKSYYKPRCKPDVIFRFAWWSKGRQTLSNETHWFFHLLLLIPKKFAWVEPSKRTVRLDLPSAIHDPGFTAVSLWLKDQSPPLNWHVCPLSKEIFSEFLKGISIKRESIDVKYVSEEESLGLPVCLIEFVEAYNSS